MRLLCFLATLTLGIGTPALAQVTQPNGTQIPQGSGVQGIFDRPAVNEAINAIADAATFPETFVPDCEITFTVLERNAGDDNAFGWYNADALASAPPAESERYRIIQSRNIDGVGAERSVRIADDPNYAGGSIGFFMHNLSQNAFYYSESRFNPGSTSGSNFIQRLVYNSVNSRAFYFAWEDRPVSSASDNDFDDLFMRVSNIICTGGGTPCDTGLDGLCGIGVEQCQGGGLSCVAQFQAEDELCDGFDNDCDGDTDEGADLCDDGERCYQGACVPTCGSGEFSCGDGTVCLVSEDICVESACADVSCSGGEVCRGGVCRGVCEGVVCPAGLVCAAGRCADLCDNVTCETGLVCKEGICEPDCDCTGCSDGLSCQPSGLCEETACVGISCDDGFRCEGGSCVDACSGVSCPSGEACVLGRCEQTESSGGASSGPPIIDLAAGVPTPDDLDGDGIPNDEDPDDDNDGIPDEEDPDADGDGVPDQVVLGESLTAPEIDEGCGCHVVNARSSLGSLLSLLLGALALSWQRRRALRPARKGRAPR